MNGRMGEEQLTWFGRWEIAGCQPVSFSSPQLDVASYSLPAPVCVHTDTHQIPLQKLSGYSSEWFKKPRNCLKNPQFFTQWAENVAFTWFDGVVLEFEIGFWISQLQVSKLQ